MAYLQEWLNVCPEQLCHWLLAVGMFVASAVHIHRPAEDTRQKSRNQGVLVSDIYIAPLQKPTRVADIL